MTNQKRGKRSFQPQCPPVINAWASIAGKKESEGPLKGYFDATTKDNVLGEKSWEKAEIRLQQLTLETLLKKAHKTENDVDVIFSGDLLNQCVGSSFAVRNTDLGALGLYGACSTMAESLLLGTMAVSGGFAQQVVAMTSSHFAASERQYRFPLDYGGQRTPTSQWTATGSGAAYLSSSGSGPVIESATIGTICDLGITDANNMGAAMAPAAVDTISRHMKDLKRTPQDYDLIVTGDLGAIGKSIVKEQLEALGFCVEHRYEDCGVLLFDEQQKDVHAGGSGCGCSAIVLCGYLLNRMMKGELKRLLFCGTGALLSPTTIQQGESIPGICHAVSIEMREG